jgi:hypothetical protein
MPKTRWVGLLSLNGNACQRVCDPKDQLPVLAGS